MVFGTLKKLVGGKKEPQGPPVRPILESRPRHLPPEAARIPTLEDIPGMQGPPEIPEPPLTPSMQGRFGTTVPEPPMAPTMQGLRGTLGSESQMAPQSSPFETSSAEPPLPPQMEERRKQRIETFRRSREPLQWPPPPEGRFGTAVPMVASAPSSEWAPTPSPVTPPQQWPAPQQQAPPERLQRRPQTVEGGLATVIDHLDRIEQRIIDLDRRLAMLESAARIR
ncbi:MAG: hypothetical protein HYS81_02590 [Candidatus Aenigmatarchaeota archaeon]|nr:MAG: hypothetical protein HYS81_02590 [Candidatus Aenigmarchaeota archaeon]